MKRSEINKALKELEAMCREYKCYLPPFCGFTPEQWQSIGHEYDEVRDCMLGWDITDYGLGDFDKVGFSLITIRNGNRKMPEKYPKVYAEKLLYIKEGQYAPNHFHWYKTEDIINRGGGNVLIRVYNSLPNEEIDYESDVTVHTDGRTYTAHNLDEFIELANTKSGFIKSMWCGDRACEDKLKEVAGVSSRCIPFEQEQIGDTCPVCGKHADKMVYWGKAY